MRVTIAETGSPGARRGMKNMSVALAQIVKTNIQSRWRT